MPTIDVEKSANPQKTEIQRTDRQNMDEMMKQICELLNQPSTDFDAVQTAVQIMIYVSQYNRLLYSSISNYVFIYHSDSLDMNVDSLMDFTCSDDFEKRLLEGINSLDECPIAADGIDGALCKKIVLKLNDHIHLVSHQMAHLKLSDEDYQKKFEKQIGPVVRQFTLDVEEQNEKITTDMQDFAKGMNSQLISLIGIFTAIAFLVFGSISEFNNIFSDISQISIFKLMMLGSIWGICLINLIYVFLFCIGKMTGLNFQSVQKAHDASIFQKYPIVWWSNFIVVMILLTNMWLYFTIYRLNAGEALALMQFGDKSVLVLLVGIIILITCAIFVFRYLVKRCDPNYKPRKNNNTQ